MIFKKIMGWGDEKDSSKDAETGQEMDAPVLYFSKDKETKEPTNPFSLQTAMRGTLITGAVGSGKTSGSGDFIATAFLRQGFGGLVLCGKIGEAQEWIDRAKRAGLKDDDIVHFKEGSSYRFNPLFYQMSRTDRGGKRTETMTTMFMALAKIGSRMRGSGSGSGSDPFWDMALERLLKSSLDILKLAKLDVTVENMTRLLTSIPKDKELLNMFDRYVLEKTLIQKQSTLPKESEDDVIERLKQEGIKMITPHALWKNNVLIQALWEIENSALGMEDQGAYNVAKQYFLLDLPTMGEKLRGSINEMFYAFANPFRSGLLATYFSQGVSEDVKPERTFEGKVIIVDFPVHSYAQLGVFAQTIYKRSWQEAVQRRDTKKHPRPVFLWIDEYQLFADPYDQEFCTTARSSRVAPVFLTQNISNLYAAIGNRDRVISMLGNLVTKIFHQNGDYNTNEYATRTIAKVKREKIKGDLRKIGSTELSEALEDQVTPHAFTMLSSGGEEYGYLVEAIITGDSYNDKKENFFIAEFEQHFAPKNDNND